MAEKTSEPVTNPATLRREDSGEDTVSLNCGVRNVMAPSHGMTSIREYNPEYLRLNPGEWEKAPRNV